MGTVIDYVKATTEDFSQRPFGVEDSIALCQLAYMTMPDFVPRVPAQSIIVSRVLDAAVQADAQLPLSEPDQSDGAADDSAVSGRDSNVSAGSGSSPDVSPAEPEPAATSFAAWLSALSFSPSQAPSSPASTSAPTDSSPTAAPSVASLAPPPLVLPGLQPPLRTVPLKELLRSECFADMAGGVSYPDRTIDLLRAMAESPRFRSIGVGHYVERTSNREREQFSAVTFDLGNGVLYLAFRGTDGSLLGWREDFDMTFFGPVPAQSSAARYARALAAVWQGPLILGGHSKGGNLAIYAAAHLDESAQARVQTVYSHDGPGFGSKFLGTEGFARIKTKIDKTAPEASFIGMLLEHGDSYHFTIVKSEASGISQHFLMTWQFDPVVPGSVPAVGTGVGARPGLASESSAGSSRAAGMLPGTAMLPATRGSAEAVVERGLGGVGGSSWALVTSKQQSALSRYIGTTVNAWLSSYEPAERKRFIDDLFVVLRASGYTDFSAISTHWASALPAMLSATRTLEPVEREHFAAILRGLVGTAVRRISPLRRGPRLGGRTRRR